MKAPLFVLFTVIIGSFTFARAQTTDELWQVVTDKLQAAENDNFYLLIGNESGVAYTFQKGSIAGSTSVQIASASKWPMSVVIQRLLEEGILDEHTRPQDIIPWWTSDPSDSRSRITVYHLLTFQSGFNDDVGCLNNQQTISLEDCVKAIYDMGTQTEPGSAFYYGGNHMQVLGYMAENKTGIDWKTLFSTYLTEPLGMVARYGGSTNPRMAGGIFSSANDYAKMVRALYLKTHLLPETIENMERDRTNVTIAYSPAPGYGWEWHYAFGHWVECNSSTFTPVCSTDEYHMRSSAGAFGFYPFIDRTHNYYGVLSTMGSTGGGSATIVYNVKDDIQAALKSYNTVPVPIPGSATPSSTNNGPGAGTPSFTSGATPILAFTPLLVAVVSLFL
jgi:CubicO group peptidase (beta-lactamase class C family)